MTDKFLPIGATGEPVGHSVQRRLERGDAVGVMVRKEDDRAEALRKGPPS